MAGTAGRSTASSGSDSGGAVRRRGEVLRAVVAEANVRRDGSLPWDLPGVAETFDDDFALVAALQLRWHTRLAGTIERTLMDSPREPEDAVLAAWRHTAGELAGVRQILDAYAAAPASEQMAAASATARRKDWMLMAAMAGRAGAQGEVAVGVGRELERRAREFFDPARDPGSARHRGEPPARPTLLDRIRAALAA